MNLCKCSREFQNNGAYQTHLKTCKGEQVDFEKIRILYRSGLLISQIKRQCNYTRKIILFALKDEIKKSRSDIAKIAHQDIIREQCKINYKICDICNRSISLSNFERHYNSHNKYNSHCRNEYGENQQIILKLYFEGFSIRDIVQKGYKRSDVRYALSGHRRSKSEASILAHKLKPESFKLNEQTKDKIRQARLKYLKEHPEDTAWRTKKISYPEKLFQQLIEQNNLTSKYDIVREYSFFPYFIDFAFVNIKLAIEIDGSQHWLKESKIERDKEKEEVLVAKGWKLYRIPEFKIKKDFQNTQIEFLEYLNTLELQPKVFTFDNEIIEYEKVKQQNRSLRKQKAEQYFQNLEDEFEKRKKDFESIDKTWGWIGQLSKLWGISHTQVRRYIKNRILCS